MAHGANLVGDGQLSNVLTAIRSPLTGETPGDPIILTYIFFNTSTTLTETVQVFINRQVSGVNRQVGQFVLGPQESQVIMDMPLGAGDYVYAITTDNLTVDYTIMRSNSTSFGFIAIDATGTSKGVSTLRQMVLALGFMIEDWPVDPGVGNYQS